MKLSPTVVRTLRIRTTGARVEHPLAARCFSIEQQAGGADNQIRKLHFQIRSPLTRAPVIHTQKDS